MSDGGRNEAGFRPPKGLTLIVGFSVVDPSGVSVEAKAPYAPEVRIKPKVVGAATSTFSTGNNDVRSAAVRAVRAYQGGDSFVVKVRSAHAGDRYWLPNLRTAQALLNIIGVAVN
jgi:hypothetical protein